MYRLGFTESTLLFYYYLDKNYDLKNYYVNSQKQLFIFFYKTSGYYDKNVNHEIVNDVLQSVVYNQYFEKLYNIIKAYKGDVALHFHDIDNQLKDKMNIFLESIGKCRGCHVYRYHVYDFMKNKNVLIISNFGSLIKQQHDNGNVKKIYDDYPSIKNIDYIEPGYTFFNNGPGESIFDNLNIIYRHIDDKINNCDVLLISCGAYSILIADYCLNTHNKKSIIVGGDVQIYFGILSKRGKQFNNKIISEKNEFFIGVPEHMKPNNYLEIEGGCYW